MFAAVASGVYATVEEAMTAMGRGFDVEYQPNTELASLYKKRYEQYKSLGEYVAAKSKVRNEKPVTA
jgi:L-ribulokinase